MDLTISYMNTESRPMGIGENHPSGTAPHIFVHISFTRVPIRAPIFDPEPYYDFAGVDATTVSLPGPEETTQKREFTL